MLVRIVFVLLLCLFLSPSVALAEAALLRAETATARPRSIPARKRPRYRAVREKLCGALCIVHLLSTCPTGGHRESRTKASKRAIWKLPAPRQMVVCLDWSKTAPTQLDSGAVASSHIYRGNAGCLGLSAEQCGRYSLSRCHERNLCSSEGHKCVLVDVNGRNVLKLNEAWATRFAQ